MDARQIADGILQREKEQILFRIAGGDIMEKRGHGESIFSIFMANNVHFRRADMRRQNGWAQIDYRLSGIGGVPLSFWFEEAEGDLETLGGLQHDLHNPADVAPGDDHDADRHRYACMTRPAAQDEEKAKGAPRYRSSKISETPDSLIEQIVEKKQRAKSLYAR